MAPRAFHQPRLRPLFPIAHKRLHLLREPLSDRPLLPLVDHTLLRRPLSCLTLPVFTHIRILRTNRFHLILILSLSIEDKVPRQFSGKRTPVALSRSFPTAAAAKFGHRRSKLTDAQLSGGWDFQLELGSRGLILKRGRRFSDATPATSFASKHELNGEFRHVDPFMFLASRQQHLLRV